jgi:hypothetical protein
MTEKSAERQFVLCIKSNDCEDIEKRKVYQVIPDEDAAREGYIRVIDESGEDYLYPESYFVRVQLPYDAEQAIVATG